VSTQTGNQSTTTAADAVDLLVTQHEEVRRLFSELQGATGRALRGGRSG
jgi:hypothetical protein